MNKVLFFHGTTIDGRKYTIAGQYVTKKKLLGIIHEEFLRLGLSMCSAQDQFCKRTGRIKAEGHMKSDRGNIEISLAGQIPEYKIADFVSRTAGYNKYNSKTLLREFGL